MLDLLQIYAGQALDKEKEEGQFKAIRRQESAYFEFLLVSIAYWDGILQTALKQRYIGLKWPFRVRSQHKLFAKPACK